MNSNTQFLQRTDYGKNINAIALTHSVRSAKLNFLAPIGLVCALGCVARFIQTCLMN